MNRVLKRSLVGLGVVVVVPVLAFAGLIAWTFSGRLPIADGADFGSVRVVKDGIVSVGVIDIGDGQVALVDAGNDAAGGAILADLARRGLGPDAVKAILLTHGHRDHMAAIPLFPKAEVVALAADADLAAGLAGGHGPISQLFPVRPTGLRVTRPVNDGDTVPLGRLQARVFALPGHTAGSAAWLVDGVLFLGDSADAASDGHLKGSPWAFSDDTDANHASLVRLATRLAVEGALVRAIVCAHSGALTRGLEPLTDFARGG
jgi:glyoxylase-like metal-dependent hydrolase (beta-lactamase superfamily II)